MPCVQQVQGGVDKAVLRKITKFVGNVDPRRMDKLSKAFGWPVGIYMLVDEGLGAQVGPFSRSFS